MDSRRPGPFYKQAFEDAEHIFNRELESVRVLRAPSIQTPSNSPSLLERVMISNFEQMRAETKANSSHRQRSLYLVSRNSSWSCLNTSLESFRELVDAYEFSDNVYDVVQAFGRRQSEIQQFRWNGCRALLTHTKRHNYEICYRVQYPVRNNRSRGDPFSMRQTGICHKRFGTHSSAWIVLQPSPDMEADIEMTVNDPGLLFTIDEDPMLPHLIFFSFQSSKWDDYVEHLRKELEPLNEAAHFSRVGRQCKYSESDYTVTFADCQRLRKFQWKLAQIIPALDGNIAALRVCEERWNELDDNHVVHASLVKARGFISEVEFHKESLQKLAEQSNRSADLLHRILDFRTSEQMERTSAAMCHSLCTLDSQAKQLNVLGTQIDRDSKVMKALTSVATFYLPASLVVTIFSSNLVQLAPTTSSERPSHFRIAPQSWLPITATLLLMVLTLILVRLLEKAFGYGKLWGRR